MTLRANAEGIRRRGNLLWALVRHEDAILEWTFAHRIGQCSWSGNLSRQQGGLAPLSTTH